MESEDFSEYHNRKMQYRLNLAWVGCSWVGMRRGGWRGGCSCQQPQPWSATFFFCFILIFYIFLKSEPCPTSSDGLERNGSLWFGGNMLQTDLIWSALSNLVHVPRLSFSPSDEHVLSLFIYVGSVREDLLSSGLACSYLKWWSFYQIILITIKLDLLSVILSAFEPICVSNLSNYWVSSRSGYMFTKHFKTMNCRRDLAHPLSSSSSFIFIKT